ncbi:MAG: thermonuclease family protein [Acidobacteria bacterium]|nr:thermonuclease family protein [Acidobacteriota bacterium]
MFKSGIQDPQSKIDAKAVILIIVVLFLTAVSAYPQSAFTGRVVQVIDGKSFVIEVPNARITAVLQYVEVPEPDQPLAQTVKDHLSAMILNQTVEFKPLGFNTEKTIGKLTLKGVDVGQQMLRDGAAWHAVYEKNGQPAAERAMYESNEAQAKAEKRGVWGVQDLKPAWEFRAEKEKAERERKRLEYERAALLVSQNRTVKAPTPPTSAVQNYASFDAWSDVRSIDKEAGVGGIIRKYDAARRFGYNFMMQAQITVSGVAKPPYLDFRMGYVYGYNANGKVAGWAIAILSDADEYKFAKSNNLTVFVGKEKIELGKAYRFFGDTGAARRETLVYLINRANLLKIANASDVKVKVGAFNGNLGNKLQNLAKNLLNSAE